MKTSPKSNKRKLVQEIVDNKGKTIDNVKIGDVVKTPDGNMGKYIKKKEYAVIDLGNGQVSESEISSLQLVKPTEEEKESIIEELESKKEIKKYIVGYINNGETWYRAKDWNDTDNIEEAELFSKEEAEEELKNEKDNYSEEGDEYFIKEVTLIY